MKTIILGIVCLLGGLGTQAQENSRADTVQSIQKEDSIDIFFIVKTVDGKRSIIKSLIVENNDIDLLYMWNAQEIQAMFGESDLQKYVLEVQVKPSINLLDRSQLLEHYNIPKGQHSLPLIVDGKKISKPGTLLADPGSIDSIRVEDNGGYIAVYTRYYLNHPTMTPKLCDLGLTLDSTKFEKVDSRPVWIEEEKQRQPGPQFILDIGRVQRGHYLPERDRTINSEANQIYRFKETDELIMVTSVYSRRLKDRDWDEIVEQRVSGYCWRAGGKENCTVEHLEEKTYRATIFLVKENKHRSANHIMYKSLDKDAFLEIIYISDLPSEERMKNLRKILKGLKMGE